MTTKPSATAWADEPFGLISIPSNRPGVSTEHSSVYCASEMAHAHNVILRGLNAIYQQAPHVPTSNTPIYKPRDVKDLLFYVRSWTKTVEHHHDTEETCMFPELAGFAGKPGLMDGPKHQHEEFTPGLDKLLQYATNTKPDAYRWTGRGGMKEIIDGFGASLTKHLNEEIDTILSLGFMDSVGLRKCWDKAEVYAKAQGNIGMLYDIFPCVLGTADKTFEGGNEFPPLPWLLPYVIKYTFALGNGAWRYNSCDFWGMPRPLYFVPHPK